MQLSFRTDLDRTSVDKRNAWAVTKTTDATYTFMCHYSKLVEFCIIKQVFISFNIDRGIVKCFV